MTWKTGRRRVGDSGKPTKRRRTGRRRRHFCRGSCGTRRPVSFRTAGHAACTVLCLMLDDIVFYVTAVLRFFCRRPTCFPASLRCFFALLRTFQMQVEAQVFDCVTATPFVADIGCLSTFAIPRMISFDRRCRTLLACCSSTQNFRLERYHRSFSV